MVDKRRQVDGGVEVVDKVIGYFFLSFIAITCHKRQVVAMSYSNEQIYTDYTRSL
jgi:hypothetical protein